MKVRSPILALIGVAAMSIVFAGEIMAADKIPPIMSWREEIRVLASKAKSDVATKSHPHALDQMGPNWSRTALYSFDSEIYPLDMVPDASGNLHVLYLEPIADSITAVKIVEHVFIDGVDRERYEVTTYDGYLGFVQIKIDLNGKLHVAIPRLNASPLLFVKNPEGHWQADSSFPSSITVDAYSTMVLDPLGRPAFVDPPMFTNNNHLIYQPTSNGYQTLNGPLNEFTYYFENNFFYVQPEDMEYFAFTPADNKFVYGYFSGLINGNAAWTFQTVAADVYKTISGMVSRFDLNFMDAHRSDAGKLAVTFTDINNNSIRYVARPAIDTLGPIETIATLSSAFVPGDVAIGVDRSQEPAVAYEVLRATATSQFTQTEGLYFSRRRGSQWSVAEPIVRYDLRSDPFAYVRTEVVFTYFDQRGRAQVVYWDGANEELVLASGPSRVGGQVGIVNQATAYPNPVRSSKGIQQMTFDNMPAGSKVKIFTLTGEEVRELQADASGIAVWKLDNKSQDSVASGIYLARIEGQGSSQTLKVAVQR